MKGGDPSLGANEAVSYVRGSHHGQMVLADYQFRHMEGALNAKCC